MAWHLSTMRLYLLLCLAGCGPAFAPVAVVVDGRANEMAISLARVTLIVDNGQLPDGGVSWDAPLGPIDGGLRLGAAQQVSVGGQVRLFVAGVSDSDGSCHDQRDVGQAGFTVTIAVPGDMRACSFSYR